MEYPKPSPRPPKEKKPLKRSPLKPKKEQKKKLVPIKRLVKKLDEVFSIYIRTKYANEQGLVKCYTSGRLYPIKEIQCGHFHSRRHYALRWDERNCRPQSYGENCLNQGNAPTFALNLIREYGPEILELLEAKKRASFKLERLFLESLIQEYKEKLEKLQK